MDHTITIKLKEMINHYYNILDIREYDDEWADISNINDEGQLREIYNNINLEFNTLYN